MKCNNEQMLNNQDYGCTAYLVLPHNGFSLKRKVIKGVSRAGIAKYIRERDDVAPGVKRTIDRFHDNEALAQNLFGAHAKPFYNPPNEFYYDVGDNADPSIIEALQNLPVKDQVQSKFFAAASFQKILSYFGKNAKPIILLAIVIFVLYIGTSDDPSVYLPDWLHNNLSTKSWGENAIDGLMYLSRLWTENREKEGGLPIGPRLTQRNGLGNTKVFKRKEPSADDLEGDDDSPEKTRQNSLVPRNPYNKGLQAFKPKEASAADLEGDDDSRDTASDNAIRPQRTGFGAQTKADHPTGQNPATDNKKKPKPTGFGAAQNKVPAFGAPGPKPATGFGAQNKVPAFGAPKESNIW
jgi:hypothetical protein